MLTLTLTLQLALALQQTPTLSLDPRPTLAPVLALESLFASPWYSQPQPSACVPGEWGSGTGDDDLVYCSGNEAAHSPGSG